MMGLIVVSTAGSAATITVTSTTDGAGSCPGLSCTLRAAVTSAIAGDQIVFAPSIVLPATITLTGGELAINRTLSIIGPGAHRLSLVAGNQARVLNVTSGSVSVAGLRMTGGRQTALSGTSGSAGTGQGGNNGSTASGGCLRVGSAAQLDLSAVAIDSCQVNGGDGGAGGSGTSGTFGVNGGRGGAGGSGGTAEGGAAWVAGSLVLNRSSIANSFVEAGNGGNGGLGGEPGQGASRGAGGDGGAGGVARGASVHVASGGALIVRNSTLVAGSVTSGSGGNGGNGGTSTAGGDGGGGGSADGGGVSVVNSATALVDVEHSTIGIHLLAGGLGGQRGNGSPQGGLGTAGSTRGSALANVGSAGVRVRGSVGLGSCFGTIISLAANLRSDPSCGGFTVAGSTTDFRTLSGVGGLAHLSPAQPSLAVDRATDCLDLNAQPVTTDQLGHARPIDGDASGTSECDLGAIEFSPQIFASGFN